MKKLFKNFKDLTRRHKVLTVVFIVVAIAVLSHQMYKTLSVRWSKEDTEVTTPSVTTSEASTEATTSVPSSEDISAMVSEMVESQVAERLAEMNSTPAVTQTAETTVPTTVTAHSVKVVPQDVTTTVTTAEPIDDDLSEITFLQGDSAYTVPCMYSVDDAVSNSTFCESNGRDIYVQLPDYVTSVSISISFRDVDNNWSVFSDFEELVLSQTKNGTEAQYSIPDNPLRNDGYYIEQSRFSGVFRLDTTDGCEYFAISY